ncbi:hypothetical protein ACO2RV_04680 [Ancylobacter sp. VNQ12]|uniref:hypothetical protein n=1 Tax=Ancylobacter sp. VNQ12 TaxID=3400920 RepID=UPI003C05EBA2
MKDWLRPGQMVACIRDIPPIGLDLLGCWVTLDGVIPVKGCIYTIADVAPGPFGLMFIELAQLPGGTVWNVNAFRPVRPTSLDCLTHLLAPSDTLEPAQ